MPAAALAGPSEVPQVGRRRSVYDVNSAEGGRGRTPQPERTDPCNLTVIPIRPRHFARSPPAVAPPLPSTLHPLPPPPLPASLLSINRSMGLPKDSWLAFLERVASHHTIPCLSEGLSHAAEARRADRIYDGDGDDISRAWAAEAIERYELAGSALCAAAGAASAVALPCVCAELVDRSNEASARAAALRAELDHDGCGCDGAGANSPVKESSKRCPCGKDKKKEDKCVCSVCVADRAGDGCTYSPGGAACMMVCVMAKPAECPMPAYACWPWYHC